MEKLSKENLKLIGSAGSLDTLRAIIMTKMYWNIVSIEPSAQFSYGRKECYDVTTKIGLNDRVIIIKDGQRYKLYYIERRE